MEALPFAQTWCVDFEFRAPAGERPEVRCMVAREVRSGRLIRLWADELAEMDKPPFPIGPDSLFVAYYASAEFGCFLALGWPMPERVLDLYVERRRIANGRGLVEKGRGLLATLRAYGLAAIDADEKQDLRNLAMRAGEHYDQAEREALLEYCQSDVDALADLLPAMLPDILRGPVSPDRMLGQALLRGRYMVAVARMEWAGVPIDLGTLDRMRDQWEEVREKLVGEMCGELGVFEGSTFKRARFARFLKERGIPWPRLPSGELDLKQDTFRQMAKARREVAPIHELRHTLSQLRLNDLAVGEDGRNRTLLSPFASKTSRNQPSNSKFIFGPSRWLRSLIKPPEGYSFVYCDFGNQEIGIAAALSGDRAMIDGYLSGDPYMAFGFRSGILPPGATAKSHAETRHLLKGTVLGIGYGMQEFTLASRLGVTPMEARNLIRGHREAYVDFWEWSESVVDRAMLTGQLSTELGWTVTLDAASQANPRSLMNFPMQANGAEMMRLACCLATEDGLEVVAPVHDALAMLAPEDQVADHTERLLDHMRSASRIVLGGFAIRAEVEERVDYPGRYGDKFEGGMWDTVMGILE